MMTRIVSSIAAAILALFLLGIYQTSQVYHFIDNTVRDRVEVTTLNFQNDVRKKGYVSAKLYDDFLLELGRTGYTYKIEMIHTKPVHYPLKSTDPRYTPEKHWILVEEKYGNREILNSIKDPSKPKDYKMGIGDSFQVKVTNKHVTGSMIFSAYLEGKSFNPIFANYGGRVENETE